MRSSSSDTRAASGTEEPFASLTVADENCERRAARREKWNSEQRPDSAAIFEGVIRWTMDCPPTALRKRRKQSRGHRVRT
jgi:hypothetical protein